LKGVQHGGQHLGLIRQSSGLQLGYAIPSPCGILAPYALPTKIVAIAIMRTTNFKAIFNELSITKR
jgi:hypothetical protein